MELPFTLAFDPPSQAAPRAVLRLRRTWLAGLLVLLAIGALRAVFEKASRPAGWMSIPNQDSIRNAMPVPRLCRFLLMLVFAMVPVVPSTTPARLAFAAGGADLATQVVLAGAVMVGNTADSIPAVDGQIVQVGDDVWAGPDGLALLTFFDGSESQLQGDSHITVEVPSGAPPGTSVSIFPVSGHNHQSRPPSLAQRQLPDRQAQRCGDGARHNLRAYRHASA